MIFKISNGGVSFGADTILERVDFEINTGEKIAIVGRNGSGKTTLLKCITGEISMEEGTGDTPFSISKVKNPVVGYLKQITFEDDSITLLEEILKVFKPLLDLEKSLKNLLVEIEDTADEDKIKSYSTLMDRFEFLGGYTYKREYSVMLKNFGFSEEDKDKPLSQFSGGERTKIAFMKLLLSHPDILLLDEPTNHLDISATKWLEGYIKAYKSAVVLVSHDRMFIEKIVDKVYEIEYGETKCYNGNYSSFEKQKRDNYTKQLKDHEYQKEEIQRLTKLIERFRYKATKAKMVQSKIKQIERMKLVDKPNRYDLKTFHASFEPTTESVKIVLAVKDLIIGYNKPLAKINLELLKNQKLAIIGDNGIGKSTLLKTLVREIKCLSGSFEFGLKTEIGYFDQQMAQYISEKSVFDDFHDAYPMLNETEVRNSLGAFLFTGEEVFKKVSELSGGERVRLALCKMFKKRPNVLILDEPTNHMDIVGKETLENMLKEYKGTLVFVSHDRYFVNKVADKLLVIDQNGANFYSFGFAEYETKEKERLEKQEVSVDKSDSLKTEKSNPKKSFTTPLKEKGKKERRVKRLDELIKQLETEKGDIEGNLNDPNVYSDYVKVSQLTTQLESVEKELNSFIEEWLTLQEELEQYD